MQQYNINAKHLQGTNFLKTGYNISSKKFQKSKSRKKNQLRKTNKQTNKQQQQQQQKQKQAKNTTKLIPSQLNFSEGFFTSSLHVSISKICLASTVHLSYEMMLFILCYFFVKAIAFIELVKAISFSVLFTFGFPL